ncbi:NHL repeat-containing protein [Calditrichota bacterium]
MKANIIILVFVFIFCLVNLSVLANNTHEPTTFVFPTYYHTYGIRKAGAFELFLFLGLKVSFSDPEGLACVRLDSWEDPEDPHDDDEVTVYGVNSGQNNIIYNKSMFALDVYGIDEEDNQLLKNPHGICANSKGDVYVADTDNHRIVRLFNPGQKLNYVTEIGSQGMKNGQFNYPHQVALDNSGNIYVSDTGNDRIQVFDKRNEFLFMFSAENSLSQPKAIAVTDSLQKHQGRINNFIIVVDSNNQRINKFNLKGRLQRRINMENISVSNAKLEYVCLDYYNQLLITDSQNHCIHKFDSNLNHITSFGSRGDDDHQFESPKGIAIYRRFGQLFIAEDTGAQYYWIGTDITSLSLTESSLYVLFTFKITEPSYISADIIDENGNFVKRIARKFYLNTAGLHKIFWDKKMGREDLKFYTSNNLLQSELSPVHQKLPAGNYTIKITAEPTYSSRTFFERIEEKQFTISE